MTQIVYRYGLHAPHEGADVVYQQMRLAHRYRNILVEIERGRRAAVRAVELEAGDLPSVMRELEVAKAVEEAAYRTVARHRAVTRKRDEPAEDKAALTAARAAVRDVSQRVRQVRETIKSSSAATAARDVIGERAKSLAHNAYDHSGVYWGQRALVEEEAAASFASTPMYTRDWQPNDPKFVRWSGDAAVALQIMSGVSVDELHGCTDSRLRLKKPDPRAWGIRKFRTVVPTALHVAGTARQPSCRCGWARTGALRCRARGCATAGSPAALMASCGVGDGSSADAGPSCGMVAVPDAGSSGRRLRSGGFGGDGGRRRGGGRGLAQDRRRASRGGLERRARQLGRVAPRFGRAAPAARTRREPRTRARSAIRFGAHGAVGGRLAARQGRTSGNCEPHARDGSLEVSS